MCIMHAGYHACRVSLVRASRSSVGRRARWNYWKEILHIHWRRKRHLSADQAFFYRGGQWNNAARRVELMVEIGYPSSSYRGGGFEDRGVKDCTPTALVENPVCGTDCTDHICRQKPFDDVDYTLL
jgi:hypothetical protein